MDITEGKKGSNSYKIQYFKAMHIIILKIPIFLIFFAITAYGQTSDTSRFKVSHLLSTFDSTKPIFKLNKEQRTNTYRHLQFSAISGYKEGIAPINGFGRFSNIVDTANGTTRIYMVNLSIQDLLTFGFDFPNNLFSLEVKDESRYRYRTELGSKLAWMRKNTYCFEYLRPIGANINIDDFKREIAHYFGVTITKEKRLVDALVLVRNEAKKHINSAVKSDKKVREVRRRVSVSMLSKIIDSLELPRMVDEAGYTGMIDLHPEVNHSIGLIDVKNALRDYDLDLIQEKRELEVFVIREIR